MKQDFQTAFQADPCRRDIAAAKDKVLSNITAISNEDILFDDLFGKPSGRAQYQHIKIATGMCELDKATFGGLTAGNFTVLRGMSGSGKTTLALQVAKHIATTGGYVIYFAYETTNIIARTKMLNSDLFLLRNKEIDGQPSAAEQLTAKFYEQFSPELWAQIQECHNDLSRLFKANNNIPLRHFVLIDCSANPFSARDIANYVVAIMHATGITPIVFIDYLQRMQPQNDSSGLISSDKSALDPNLDTLTYLAKTYGVTIIGLSSISKSYYKMPLDDAADEGSVRILYSADELYVLDYERADKNVIVDTMYPEGYRQMFLHSKKNREALKAVIPLKFYPRADFFDDGQYLSGKLRTTHMQCAGLTLEDIQMLKNVASF